MRKHLLFYILIMASHFAFSQENAEDDNHIFVIVQQMPRFKEDINKYLADSVRVPQTDCIGPVFVNFTIEKDGSISGVKVLKGIQVALNLIKKQLELFQLCQNGYQAYKMVKL